jgi:peptidyl-tRNA hydrolase, PTH1 family
MSKFLIVGLGNIGDEYAETRHNIGFKVVDHLASEAQAKFTSDRLADKAILKHKGKQLILIKPSTYMNLSGKAVNYWLQAEKVPITNLMVIVDELALPFGKIRIGPKGSDGGHNGLKSIQEVLGTAEYPRLRFGIGKSPSQEAGNKGSQVEYVLGKWTEEERKTIDERIKVAAEAIKSFTFMGLQRCMNEFNTR